MLNHRRHVALGNTLRRCGVLRRCPCWPLVVCVALVAICGCGPRGPAVEMVHGIVLLDGSPVEGATVFFSPQPEDGKSPTGLPAAGRTGTDGTFTLNATGGARSGAGTGIGEYVVTVVKQEGDPPPVSKPGQPPLPPPMGMKIRDVLPVRYKNGSTSPLRATVVRGTNSFRFELSSADEDKAKKKP